MRKIPLTFVYPTDPLGPKVGGVEAFIKGCIKYSPDDFLCSFVGITSDPASRPPKQWQTIEVSGKSIRFFPLFHERNENKKTVIPLSLRFTYALKCAGLSFDDQVLLLNRIEPVIAIRKSAAPKIGVVHTDIEKQIAKNASEVLWSRFSAMYGSFERKVFPYFSYIYTVSMNSLNYFHSRYPEQSDKFAFLPTWVDPDVFSPGRITKDKTKAQCPYNELSRHVQKQWIVFAGRIQETKAPFRLIDTFKAYHDHHQKSVLIMIGEGNLRKQAQEYTQTLSIADDVVFLKNMNQNELAYFFRAADLFLLTSNYEGMPRCVLEALGSGTPVVTTDVGEVKRVVQNGFSGEVISGFEPTDIAEGIKKVLGNPHTYNQKNCLAAVSEFKPDSILIDLYEKVRILCNRHN